MRLYQNDQSLDQTYPRILAEKCSDGEDQHQDLDVPLVFEELVQKEGEFNLYLLLFLLIEVIPVLEDLQEIDQQVEDDQEEVGLG